MSKATSSYYVKNSAESGNPTRIDTGSKRAAVKIFAGRNPREDWTFEVWTENEWQQNQAPSTYSVYDL